MVNFILINKMNNNEKKFGLIIRSKKINNQKPINNIFDDNSDDEDDLSQNQKIKRKLPTISNVKLKKVFF